MRRHNAAHLCSTEPLASDSGRHGWLGRRCLFEGSRARLLVDDAHRELDLAAIVVAHDLDLDPVAFLDDVAWFVNPLLGELGNVDEAVLDPKILTKAPKSTV